MRSWRSGRRAGTVRGRGSVEVAVDYFQFAPDHGPLDDQADPGFTWVSPGDTAGVLIQTFDWERGRPSDVDKVTAGQGTVTIIDKVGALDPTNPNSPWWDSVNGWTKVNPRKPARLQVYNPVSGVFEPVITGHISNIKYVIAETGEYATCTITILDDLELLSRAEVIPGTSAGGTTGAASGNAVYQAQQVDDRLLAAVADASLAYGGTSWPASRIRFASGNVALQQKSYAAKTTLLTVIDDAVDAEFPGVANRYCRRDGLLRFRGRYERFDWQNYTVALGGDLNVWNVGDLAAFAVDNTRIVMQNGQESGAGPFAFDRSDDNLVNAAYAAPANIKPSAVPGQLAKDTASIQEFGLCSISFEDLIVLHGDESNPGPQLNANDETSQYAGYYVDNRKRPQNRPETLTFGTEDPAGPYANVWAFLTTVELTDVVKLKTTHPGGGGFPDVVHFVESIKGTCKPGPIPLVSLQVEVSPGGYFSDDQFAK